MYDSDRFEVLAGLTSHSEYRRKALNEMEAKIVLTPDDEEEQALVNQLTADLSPDEVEVETLAGMAALPPGSGSDDVSPEEELVQEPSVTDVPEDIPVEEEPLDEPLEERLRRIIRNEVQSIVAEEIAKRDDKQIAHAQKTRSVSAAMGYSSFGDGSPKTKASVGKKWSPTLGFPGIGFK